MCSSDLTTPLITGTAQLATGHQLQVSVNSRTYTLGSSPELQLSGTAWSLSIPAAHALADGTYNVLATISDAFGNSSSDSSNAELQIDTTAPAVSITSASSTSLYNPVLSGRAEANASLHLQLAGASWTFSADAGGAWQLDKIGRAHV